MARYVVTKATLVAGSGYNAPPRLVHAGEVLELSAAEVTAIGGGNMRAVATTTTHETSGEAFAVSNGF
jgi:hypothetical protein